MKTAFKTLPILGSIRCLQGNTRTSVFFEPLWGIPYVLYTFYLSLYMKELGVNDIQLGYIIAISAVASALFAMIGGVVTDLLGRKRTTLIFDLLAWPGALLIYLLSDNFWLFALATFVNSAVKVVSISWNLMVIEDADPHQQLVAYNLINIINLSTGFLVPLAGWLVAALGILNGERILLGFALVSMAVMILGRNHCYRETGVGRQVMAECRRDGLQNLMKRHSLQNAWISLREKPSLALALSLVSLFNAFIPIGTFTSLYYAPYLTEALKLDRSAISFLGGAGPAVMFLVFVFVNPRVPATRRFQAMIVGLIIQILALAGFIMIRPGRFGLALLVVASFAVGFSITKPFLDTVMAHATSGKERAGVYSLSYTLISVLTAFMGVISGYLYQIHPGLIFGLSILLLAACLSLLLILQAKYENMPNPAESTLT